nr:uncharacterized protein LOC109179048 [Ipomoea trifida]
MMLAVVEFVHNFTSVSQILSSDYLQRIYGCSHVFAKWNSKSTSTVLPSVDSSERRSCGSQTCTDRPKLEREDSYLLLQMRLDVVNFREDSRVFQCVENILKVRYRNFKHALHKEFLKYTSATEAKLHVPKGLTTDNWNELCDFWSKGDVLVKCMINSWCRNQQKMPHNQGSAAFVPVFNELKKMVAMLETSELEGNPMTVVQVYDVIMGKKSGYIKGMGNGPKPVTSTSTRANNSHLEEKMIESNNERKHSTKE